MDTNPINKVTLVIYSNTTAKKNYKDDIKKFTIVTLLCYKNHEVNGSLVKYDFVFFIIPYN